MTAQATQEDVFIYGYRGASDWLYDHGYVLGVGTLMNMVSKGNGPPCEKWGKWMVFTEADLLQWANDRWVS